MNETRAICLGFLCVLAGNGHAQSTPIDRVWLAPSKTTEADSGWYPQAVKVIAGKVGSLDNKQLSILVVGDQVPSRLAAHRVIWIEPGKLSDKETAALKLFADGDYTAAVKPLVDVTSERPAVWRQQWILMLSAFAAKNSSRGAVALELVSQLDQRPLAPYVLAWLPIAWENHRQPAASSEAARGRLADDSPAVRLVAASWLLSSPDRNQAIKLLKQLSVDAARPLIAGLAEAVLWRTATPPQAAENAEAWQQRLSELPLVLQTGPMIALAEKFESAGLQREAQQMKLSLELTPAIPYPIK